MPARRISFVNFKGGVGKTSIIVNVAACLAYDLGQKVLLVDCDAQSNASIWLMGIERWNVINSMPGKSVYGMFIPNLPPITNNIIPSVVRNERGMHLIPNLDLLPATYELMDLEEEYRDGQGEPFFYRFHEHLRSTFNHYDYVLFDCPPNLFRASKCAIFASEEIYVPCNPDKLSEIGLSLLVSKIDRFHKQTVLQQQQIPNFRPAKIRGVILNDVDGRAQLEGMQRYLRLTIAKARQHHVVSEDADILGQQVRKAILAAKVVGSFLPVNLSNGSSGLKDDYLNLARFIHNTPLYKEVEHGTDRKTEQPRRTAKRAS